MARATYVFRDGKFVEKSTGRDASSNSGRITMPLVVRDLPPYRSPIDGRVIDGRAARREDLARNGCVEVEPGMFKGRAPEGFRNEKLARKLGAIR